MWYWFVLPVGGIVVWLLWRDVKKSVAPYVALPKDVRKNVIEALELKPGDRVIELGSGNGDFLLELSREHCVAATGIELDPLHFVISWLRVTLKTYFGQMTQIGLSSSPPRVLYGDFFAFDLSGYNKVYAYLMKRSYARLKEKFEHELRPGSIVVLAGWPLDETQGGHQIVRSGEERIFVYRY